jgi:hypothetical protein
VVAPRSPEPGVGRVGGNRARAIAGLDLVEHGVAVIAGGNGLSRGDLHLGLALIAGIARSAGGQRKRLRGIGCIEHGSGADRPSTRVAVGDGSLYRAGGGDLRRVVLMTHGDGLEQQIPRRIDGFDIRCE